MINNHGADLFELSRKSDKNIKNIIDFSSNINPLGVSETALLYLFKNINMISMYPDTQYKNLKKSISTYCNTLLDYIFLSGGATECLINSLKALSPKNALILAPCYSEYEKELKKLDANIFRYNLYEKNLFNINIDEIIAYILNNKIDTFVFANPNNPTGTILSQEDIKKILKIKNLNVIIDETYIEFTDTEIYSCSNLVNDFQNLIVIRGTSKFFSTPGIRLGYMLTSSDILGNYFKNTEIIWNINTFAALLGEKMFKDTVYITNTYTFIQNEINYLYNNLKEIKYIMPFKTKGNFILSKITKNFTAKELRKKLFEHNMVIRDVSNFENLNEYFFRICVNTHENNEKLIHYLKKYLND